MRAIRNNNYRFHFRGGCRNGDKCEYSRQIDGPTTYEEIEDFIYAHKLNRKAADFLWNQTEPVNRAIVYREDM